jgi:hypothetical protein
MRSLSRVTRGKTRDVDHAAIRGTILTWTKSIPTDYRAIEHLLP